MKKRKRENQGFAALASVLVIAAIIMAVTIAVPLLSISDSQSSFSTKKSKNALGLVESCLNDATYQLQTFNTLPSTVTNPVGTCTITTEDHTGTVWTFTVSGTLATYTKNFRITLRRDYPKIVIQRWQEY